MSLVFIIISENLFAAGSSSLITLPSSSSLSSGFNRRRSKSLLEGGTGQHKLSDPAQIRKWRELQHALASNGEVTMAAHALLERDMRQLEYLMPLSLPRTFPLQQHRFLKCFAASLIEWGADAQCELTVTPSSSFYPNDSPITPYLHPQTRAHLLSTLQQRDILPRKGNSALADVTPPFDGSMTPSLRHSAIRLVSMPSIYRARMLSR